MDDPAIRGEIETKLGDFCDRFSHHYWNGPFWGPPEQGAALGQALGYDSTPKWEVWMEKPGVPDSLGRGIPGIPLRAALRFTDAEVVEMAAENLARRLAAIVAGHEAHEALEFARFDDGYVVDPHGSLDELVDVSALVTEYLTSSARLG
jgi:hypothetical protein